MMTVTTVTATSLNVDSEVVSLLLVDFIIVVSSMKKKVRGDRISTSLTQKQKKRSIIQSVFGFFLFFLSFGLFIVLSIYISGGWVMIDSGHRSHNSPEFFFYYYK